MAAKKFYNVFEVIEKVTESDETNEDGDSYDEGDQVEEIVQSKMTELAEAAVKLEPALQPNMKLFETHAVRIILPWLQLCAYPEISSVHTVLKSSISCGSILQTESRLWLRLVNRRIGGRLRIRNPYYAEMKRDLPYDAYRALELSIKNSTLQHFKEPHCDIAGNRKGTVIAFTSEKGVLQLFTMLSGKKEEEVKRYFRRSLKRRGKAKLIVNTEKDFSLIYKFNKGQIPPGTRIFFPSPPQINISCCCCFIFNILSFLFIGKIFMAFVSFFVCVFHICHALSPKQIKQKKTQIKTTTTTTNSINFTDIHSIFFIYFSSDRANNETKTTFLSTIQHGGPKSTFQTPLGNGTS